MLKNANLQLIRCKIIHTTHLIRQKNGKNRLNSRDMYTPDSHIHALWHYTCRECVCYTGNAIIPLPLPTQRHINITINPSDSKLLLVALTIGKKTIQQKYQPPPMEKSTLRPYLLGTSVYIHQIYYNRTPTRWTPSYFGTVLLNSMFVQHKKQ